MFERRSSIKQPPKRWHRLSHCLLLPYNFINGNRLIPIFVILTVYVLISTWLAFYLIIVVCGYMYRPDYDPLILGPGDWYGITCFVLEIVLSVGVLIQNVLWLYETCFKSANVHSGMKMVFYSIILTSVLMIIGRLIILYGDTYRGSISVQTAMGAKYFHDTASLQFPMNPILMTLERLIATQRFKTYEVAKRPNIVIFMNVASWTYAIWMQFGSAYSLGAQVYMITVYFQFFLQFCTVALMIYLYKKNLKRYNNAEAKTLTERYQTAENIRLLRAVFKFMFINVTCDLIVLGFSFILQIEDHELLQKLLHYIGGLWNLVFAGGLFLIHFLFLMATGLCGRLFGTLCCHHNSMKNAVMKSVTGKVVPLKAQADDYFKQFSKAWK